MTLTRRYVDFSYVDGNEYVFMDKEDYTPYTFTKDQIEEELLFMPEGRHAGHAGADLGRSVAGA